MLKKRSISLLLSLIMVISAMWGGAIPVAAAEVLVFEENFAGKSVDPNTQAAPGWKYTDTRAAEKPDAAERTTAKNEIVNNELVTTITNVKPVQYAESIQNNIYFKVYESEYDPATHSATYRDRVSGKYKVQAVLRPEITAELVSVGFTGATPGKALSRGVGLCLKKEIADIWRSAADGGTLTIYPSTELPHPWNNDNTVNFIVDTSSKTCEIQMNSAEAKQFNYIGWGEGYGIGGMQFAMKENAKLGDKMIVKSVKLYEIEAAEPTADETAVDGARDAITISDLTDTPDAVTESLKTLPGGSDPAVVWTSGNTTVLGDDGTLVASPAQDTEVTMTAAITKNNITKYKEFRVTVKANGVTPPTESPVTTPPVVTPPPTEPPAGEKLIYDESFADAQINPGSKMAKGWIASDEMQSMTEHSTNASDGALVVTKTAAAISTDNGEKLTMNYPLKVYDAPYDPATHSAVYTDELFGKYRLEVDVKAHITGGQLAAVGFSKKSGETLAKGAGVSLKKSQADVWIGPGDTQMIETGGSPNDKYNQIKYTLDTNNNGVWNVQFGDNPSKDLNQNWGGLAGIYLGMKPSNDAGETISLKNAKIYEIEKYAFADEPTINKALGELVVGDLTDTPDAVIDNLKNLKETANGCEVTWVSSNPDVITNEGVVKRPIGDDAAVVMTASVSAGGRTKYKELRLTVKANNDVNAILKAAADALTYEMITNEDKDNLTQSLKSLPAAGLYGTTITWKSSDKTVMLDDGTLVTLGEKTKLPVTMTATLTLKGTDFTKDFPLHVGIDFSAGLYTLYQSDFSGSTVPANIEKIPGVGKIYQQEGKLYLDRTGTDGGTTTTVRIRPAIGDTNIVTTGEMILNVDVHLPANCEKVEIIPCDSKGNRITTIYSGKEGGKHKYTYVARKDLDGQSDSEIRATVTPGTDDLTIKMEARFNFDTKRLTLKVDDNTGSQKTLIDNKFIRDDATNLDYIEINSVDNKVQNTTYKNKGIVEVSNIKVTVNKGYVPQYIANSVDYYSAIEDLKGFVSGDINLNTTQPVGTKLTWSSSKPAVIGNDGKMAKITENVENIVMKFRLEMADDPSIFIEYEFDPITAIYIPEGNLALNKTAKSSVGSKKGCGPENAVDGNVGTRWETAKSSNLEEPALTVDFGQPQVFNQIMLKEAEIVDIFSLRGYVVETSIDGKNFTQLTSGTTLGNDLKFINVKETLARYVRFRVTEKVLTSNVGLMEMQIYLNGGEATHVAADLLILKYQLGSLMGLTGNVELPQTGALYGTKFDYTSTNTSALRNDGTVMRVSETKTGVLNVDAYAKTGEDASGNPIYATTKTTSDSMSFSVVGTSGGGGGTQIGGNNRPISGGSSGGGGGAALPTGPAANSNLGNETGTQATGSFGDVRRDYWAYNYIETLKSKRIVSGDENGNYNPEAQITREEFLKMLMTSLDIVVGDAKEVTLSDVSSGDWCYNYIAKAMELGITSGVSDTAFGVGQAITREDMAVLCTRAMEAANRTISQTNEEKNFADDAQISSYAKESVQKMQQAGVINGYENGTFDPQKNASRGEAAKIICEVMK